MLALKRQKLPMTFESIFDDIFDIPLLSIDNEKPVYDVIETDENYIIKTYLAGIKKDDIKIKIENGTLSIKAKRKEEENVKYNYKKSFAGTYKLYFKLQDNMDIENINATMEDGILKITLQKIKDPEKLGQKIIEIT